MYMIFVRMFTVKVGQYSNYFAQQLHPKRYDTSCLISFTFIIQCLHSYNSVTLMVGCSYKSRLQFCNNCVGFGEKVIGKSSQLYMICYVKWLYN